MIHNFKSNPGFTILSKENQKTIVGGRVKVICTCNNSPLMETVVCSANSLAESMNCLAEALKYCKNQGFSGIDCIASGGSTS